MSRFFDDIPNGPSVCRFSDLPEDPQDMLPPIRGYEEKPLVTLEEAVKPLESIVEEVDHMVYTLKRKCNQPEDGLTKDESASIMLYTLEWTPPEKSFYALLNKDLRAQNRRKLIPWFSYLRLFIHSLSKLPESSSRIIYRGVNLDLSRAYDEGGEDYIWWAFSSCTSNIGTLENHIGKTGERTIFNITFDSGKDISGHSYFPEEKEVLLYPARQFKVTGKLNAGHGLHIIDLQETKPRYPLFRMFPAEKLSVQSINILLIGEKGVGKSTFINALVNYFSFNDFEQAQSNRLVVLKPLSFRVLVNNTFKDRLITFGNLDQIDSSTLQQCHTYTFNLPHNNRVQLSLIDTPSFDETSKSDQIKHILDYVNRLSHLNAICFLLQPDAQQLNTNFQTCFAQLITRLGPNIRNNVIFCFTNALVTFSTPGSTAPLLRTMLRNHSMDNIRFSRQNTFFFENESFRYLVAVNNGLVFSREEKEEYTTSWVEAVEESNRFLETILTLRPT